MNQFSYRTAFLLLAKQSLTYCDSRPSPSPVLVHPHIYNGLNRSLRGPGTPLFCLSFSAYNTKEDDGGRWWH